MADIWFYTRGGKQMDPVSMSELRQLASRGHLKPTDMVWQEGMPQWIRASAAQGLFDDRASAGNGNGMGRPPVESSRRSGSHRGGSDRGEDSSPYAASRAGPRRGMGTGAKVAIVAGVVLLLAGLAVAAVLLKMNSETDPIHGKIKDTDKVPIPVPVVAAVIEEYKVDKLPSLRENRREISLTAGTMYEVTAETEPGQRVTVYLDDNKLTELAKHKDAIGTAKVTLSPAVTGKHWLEIINEADLPATIKVTVRALGKGDPGKVPVVPVVGGKDLIDDYEVFLKDLGDDKRFIEVKAGTKYEVTATSDKGCKLEVYVDDEANREIAKAVALRVGVVTFTPAATGRYRIEIVNIGIGDSKLTVKVRSLGADIGGPIAKVDPPVVAPTLVMSYKVDIQELKDDRRTVDLKAGVLYEITTKSAKLCSMDLFLDDEGGREVAQRLNVAGTGKITYTPPVDGKHRIEVVNLGVGDSEFAVEVRSMGGGIAKGDGKFPFIVDSFDVFVRDLGSSIRMYDFEMDTRYEISVTNDKGANMNLYVVNNLGLDVATDNRPDASCFVSWTCTQTGKYKVEVSNQGLGDATAKVLIRAVGKGLGGIGILPPPFKDKIGLPPFPDPKVAGALPAGKLVFPTKFGARLNEMLAVTDIQDPVRIGSFCKVYQVNMKVGKTYTIDMIAGYDTYLRLVDAKGFQLASDDDGGEGLNARLIYSPLAAGNYRIICTSYRGGSTGAFTLIVRED